MSKVILVALDLLCGSSAFVAGLADAGVPLSPSPVTWITREEEALLRRSYLRCVASGYRRAGYAQSRKTLELAYQHQMDDLTVTVTSQDIADAPKELEQQTLHISCQWFEPGQSPRRPG